jgi:hypothetical protein
MTVKTSGGAEITDEMFEAMAAEYETGDWSGHLTEVVMGRPRISSEELVNVTFRVPKSRGAAIARIAKEKGETRSEFLRNAVDRAIVAS